jgi:hypothetical protein
MQSVFAADPVAVAVEVIRIAPVTETGPLT